MNITNAKARSVADTIDAIDEQIAALQESKRETFSDLRADLEADGHNKASVKLDIAALKAAIAKRAKRSKDADAVQEHDALAESYLDAIERSAPRATPAIATVVPTRQEPSGADTGSTVGAGAPIANRTLVEA